MYILVPPRGIEPRSDALQAPAMTTSAKAAILAHRTGFEPVIFALKGQCPRPLDERCIILVPSV